MTTSPAKVMSAELRDVRVECQSEECPDESARRAPWADTIAKYKQSDALKSWWQVGTTFVPLAALWSLMYVASFWSIALTLLLAIPTAAFLVRVFIIQHDCGHHSFFRNRRANDILGSLCGVLTLTPYHHWRRTHSLHHTSSGNLSQRGHGDVWTLTVDEYKSRSWWGRLAYRIYRHPLFMFFPATSYLFIIHYRLTLGVPRTWRRERNSIHVTNLCLMMMFVLAHYTIGLPAFLSIWLPVVVLGAAIGGWLFFIQHQYEDAYWQPKETWDFADAALAGSSYYKLPAVLQWLTGNIGFHHIHHLNSRIPNYHLAACHDAEPELQRCTTIGLWESFQCPSLKLWDEKRQQMVGFKGISASQEQLPRCA